jgi:rare lipoprotein A
MGIDRLLLHGTMLLMCISVMACGIPSSVYRTTTGTIRSTCQVTKGVTKLTMNTGEVVYKIGHQSFKVLRAPISWTLTHEEIETIGGLPPKDAIRQGRVKNTPYVVNGKKYYPMSVEEAAAYRQVGVASWYGMETRRKKGGHMTANGEAFVPQGLTAAHRLLPLPTFVRVTNLTNRRSVIVRVNDRGPFVEDRIIDLTAGAARRLGFYDEGTTRVLVQTVHIE